MTRSLGLLERPGSVLEQYTLKHGVPADDEFKRIDKLPRRTWTASQIAAAQRRLTKRLRTPNGERELWPDQAIALSEIGWYGGVVGGIRVSGGKTTISFLAATMLDDCPRPLLLCPSKSIRTGKVAKAYKNERKHWRVRGDYTWLAYEQLQRKAYADYLFHTRPGIIILDEAHYAGRYDTGRSKRIQKYVDAYPEVPVIVLTGSLIASKVVNDSLKLCYWSRRKYSPLPIPSAKRTQRYWKLALDSVERAKPGALRQWAAAGESTVHALGRRYVETPGIVCSQGENVIGTSLTASAEFMQLRSLHILHAFEHIRSKRTPDGRELLDTDGGNTWIVAQTLALGFYYVYDPEPPADWLDAYRNWCSYCREHIQDSSCECDTEARVREHVLAVDDEYSCWPLHEWLRIKHIYQLRRKPIWLSSDTLAVASRWMHTHKHGLIWTQFRAFGEALAAFAKVPYYGSHAKDRVTRKYITAHPTGHPAVASLKTCSDDIELQHIFSNNLFPAPSATGAHIEQAIARTHRFGCDFDEVTATFWLACAENRDNLSVAKLREKQAAELTGDPFHKLLIADWSTNRLKKLDGPQWIKTRISKNLMR